MRALLALASVALCATSSMAAPRIAVHPLVVIGGDPKANEQARNEFLAEAARQPIELVSRGEVLDALVRAPKGSCVDAPGCLERIGKDTHAVLALLATLRVEGAAFVLGAKLVAPDGSLIKSIEALTVEKDLLSPRAPQVQAAIKKLFAQLDLDHLPSPSKAPPVAVVKPPEVVVAPQPVEPAPAKADSVPAAEVEERATPSLRVAGLTVGGLSLAAAGVGVGIWLWTSGDARALKVTTQTHGGAIFDDQQGTAGSINSRYSLGTGLVIGAAVGAAASVAMLLVSADWGSRVAIAPVRGGAVVGLSGEF